MIALFGLGGAWQRAAIRFVACRRIRLESGRKNRRGSHTRLLAVIAQTLGGGADLSKVANIAALKAGTARERRHGDKFVGLFIAIISTAGDESTIVSRRLPEDLPAAVRGIIWRICLEPLFDGCRRHRLLR
jgi:hypothetical protein